MRTCLIMALLLTTASFVMAAISISIPYWMYTDSPNEMYQGLWQRCEKKSGNIECELLLLQPEFLDATRTMMIFGMCFYLFATICTFMYTFVKTEKTSLGTAATFLDLFGGMLCMIGVIVYGSMHNRLLRASMMNLHAGFGLAVVSTVTGFVSTLTFCMSKARGEID